MRKTRKLHKKLAITGYAIVRVKTGIFDICECTQVEKKNYKKLNDLSFREQILEYYNYK